MRWYKTVTRIFLILSVVDFTFAGLGQSRAMQKAVVHSLKVAEDMIKPPEKWQKPLDELSEPSTMHPHSREDSSDDSVMGPKADTPLESATDDENKFLNEEWKAETKEDMVFTFALAAVSTLVSESSNAITGPADPGA